MPRLRSAILLKSFLANIGISITTLFRDYFTDSDGTLLPDHTPDYDAAGNGYTVQRGTWRITSNLAYLAASGGNHNVVVSDVGESDVLIEVTLTTIDQYPSIVIRSSDADNNFLWQARGDGYYLYKREAATSLELGSWTGAVPANGDVIKVDCTGTSIRCYVGGVKRLTVTNAFNLTVTKHGLSSFINTVNRYNNLTIKKKVSSYVITDTEVTYASTIDSINIKATLTYPSVSNMPILVCMHSFSTAVSSFNAATRMRLAGTYGNAFCVFVEMRGRGTSAGTEDCGSREIQDIIDAVEYVKDNYAASVDEDQIYVVGWSGGGGNVFSLLSKFPDYFNGGVACYGISDYGHDGVDGWYQNGASAAQITLMESWIGDTPGNVPNNYHSRDSLLAITNYTDGHLFMFHDDQDSSVPIVNTDNIRDALDGAGIANYTRNVTGVADDPRWLHEQPNTNNDIILSEAVFMPDVIGKTYAAWTVPLTGTLEVAGFLDTKRFSLWLGDGTAEYGNIVYNMTTRVFTISVDTGAYTYTLKLKGQTPNASISSTINGGGQTETSDANGVVTYTG